MNDIKLALLGSPGAGKSGGGTDATVLLAITFQFWLRSFCFTFYSDMLGCFIYQ